LFSRSSLALRFLPPFPTRRSSDLTHCSLVSLGTEKMLVNFGQANLLEKARQQPERVGEVINKMKTDGIKPTVEAVFRKLDTPLPDRKSTRLNSSHVSISYAVFCLK